ncbi:GMC family oxidoreductase N-terminal domain-containing protein [Yinghuangia soli]|uniref:GMC family oxidoreductase N-terminal domain-containing protein n=1 Tax=Yinghuangia soli TaxID=2908204 RepID=A0AA41U610_9ACTN|nr:GMC family oxidoreductase N-terminal domain-containing protein [Yinghuangia soli]MCF2532457.1 GMC family oxidoreductase N-terminal domain-containing protein [Yinghuangia soli]
MGVRSVASADVVMVGAGSAGCVLAARLSEDPERTVLLLEAGPDHREVDLPEELRTLSRPVAWPYNWGDRVASTGGRELNYARGRGVGGSSATNGAVALRPEPEDFDAWPRELGWDRMLAYLNRVENDLDFGAEAYHGDAGPIPIVRHPEADWTSLQRGFVDGCVAAGLEFCADHSRPGSTGVGAIPMNRRGSGRVSNAIAYLEAARDRANVTIWATAMSSAARPCHRAGLDSSPRPPADPGRPAQPGRDAGDRDQRGTATADRRRQHRADRRASGRPGTHRLAVRRRT